MSGYAGWMRIRTKTAKRIQVGEWQGLDRTAGLGEDLLIFHGKVSFWKTAEPTACEMIADRV